jgi:hypothetical protein
MFHLEDLIESVLILVGTFGEQFIVLYCYINKENVLQVMFSELSKDSG